MQPSKIIKIITMTIKKELYTQIILNLWFILICGILIYSVQILPKDIYTATFFKIVCFVIVNLFSFTVCGFYFLPLQSEDITLKKIILHFFSLFKKVLLCSIFFSTLKLSVFILFLYLLRFSLQQETIIWNIFAGIVLFCFFYFEFSVFWFVAEFYNSINKTNSTKNIFLNYFLENLKRSVLSFQRAPFFTCKIFLISIVYILISVCNIFIIIKITTIAKMYRKKYVNLQVLH